MFSVLKMAVPQSIRSVPRPKNTVVVDSGHEGVCRYAVRERSGMRYGPNGEARPVNGRVIGHICNGIYVPVNNVPRTASKGPEELSFGAAASVFSEPGISFVTFWRSIRLKTRTPSSAWP